MPEPLPKHVHVIGICGVATSALAIAFHKRGVKVTGSDKGFYPPVSTELERQGISFYAGWHPDKMVENGVPDLVVVTTASGTTNPETLYAEQHSFNVLQYTKVFQKYFIRPKSVVVAGTWGKTSSAALLSHIFDLAQFDPSYMFGGISLSHDSSARISDSNWSVFEGDEYKSSPTDSTAKFFYYNPTHILLTKVSWDHADLYPTEVDFMNVFRRLLSQIPKDGMVVARKGEPGIEQVISSYKGQPITYGSVETNADYIFREVKQSAHGLSFTISHGNDSWNIVSGLLGDFQAENITGCFALAHSVGIDASKIISAIGSFKGLKRRLEKRLDEETSMHGITVIDDIAHSPEKSRSILKTLKEIYPGKIIAVFEPNIGGRKREALAKYDHAFSDADIVVIPRLTKLKIAENSEDQPIEGAELTSIIAKTHANTKFIDDDTALVDFLVSETKKGDVIAFLGSHGFRGMIEEIVSRIK